LALLCRATDGRCLLSLPHLPLLICIRWPVDTMHFCPNSKRFPLNTLENTIIVIWTRCEELRCSCYPPPWPWVPSLFELVGDSAQKQWREIGLPFSHAPPWHCLNDDVTIDGTINLCSALGVRPEPGVLLAVVCDLRSPIVGRRNNTCWVWGWKGLEYVSLHVPPHAPPRFPSAPSPPSSVPFPFSSFFGYCFLVWMGWGL
jgi:hypothetical protein